jgi:hypothetical protein
VFAVACVAASGCGVSDRDVEQARAAHCPRCTVVKWAVGEGDGAFAYVHATLRCANVRGDREAVWQLRNDGGEWVAARALDCGEGYSASGS